MQFPLECVCSHRTDRSQLAFAQRALELLDPRLDCSYQATTEGLLIRGETEESVGNPVDILRAAYGEALQVGELIIRYQSGSTVQEPHMGLRLSFGSELTSTVCGDLHNRGAVVLSTEIERSLAIVRGTAPLARLLGYADWLRGISGGRARAVMWMSHYAPLARDV